MRKNDYRDRKDYKSDFNAKDNKKNFKSDERVKEPFQKDIIYGKNPVFEALESGSSVIKVFTCDPKISSELKDNKIDVVLLSKDKFFNTYGSNCQNVVAQIKDFEYYDIDRFLKQNYENSLVLVLDHIEDVGNLGAMLRSAEVFGVDLVIIPDKRSAEINAVAWKTSAGAVNHVKISKVNNLKNALEKLKEKGYWIYGGEADSSENIYNIDFDQKTVLVIGSEGKGISRLIRESLDFDFFIPMYGKLNSLNASVACGVTLSEIRRKIEIKR
ncbi:MAG: 23S rRNA (guanosine(2251)-2'-O)-methyltransferase RlmB [Candidatus Muirbacterium halophilum]|nr:23S rRNA (guanosine(2251)-2'-O)-methyltransferase RlmB [Candidatus Muirbacterium halophilum]MCK9477681.1 23S rRNA (guanosine(2251)-2'-O)-methyltransferase RlmB [Candidatus Muirbacterium halophilum]